MKVLLRLLFILCFSVSGLLSANSQAKKGNDIGDIAPEIKMKNPDGETISLSDIEGKIVLIDFWASWCGPCRRENPYVVQAYHTFKDKKFNGGDGFTIFSVSLDNKQKAWEEGILADELVWPYHVCDFAAWKTRAAAIYGVRGIPSNFLINKDGVIVAKNLRGPALEAKLKELLKN